MKGLPNFKRYMTFNGVDDEALKNVRNLLRKIENNNFLIF